MKRIAALVLAVTIMSVGCAGQTGPTGPTFAPSKACGGFHVVIANTGPSPIEVRLNTKHIADVAAGDTADIPEYGNYGAPTMPWDVEVIRIADGAVLLATRLGDDHTDGRRFEIASAPLTGDASTPYVC